MTIEKAKAPPSSGDALFANIESALVWGVVDAKAEIERRFPRGKTPRYEKRWRELAMLMRKERGYARALMDVDQARQALKQALRQADPLYERPAASPLTRHAAMPSNGSGHVGHHEHAAATAG